MVLVYPTLLCQAYTSRRCYGNCIAGSWVHFLSQNCSSEEEPWRLDAPWYISCFHQEMPIQMCYIVHAGTKSCSQAGRTLEDPFFCMHKQKSPPCFGCGLLC